MVRTNSNPLKQMEVPHGTKVVSHLLSGKVNKTCALSEDLDAKVFTTKTYTDMNEEVSDYMAELMKNGGLVQQLKKFVAIK